MCGFITGGNAHKDGLPFAAIAPCFLATVDIYAACWRKMARLSPSTGRVFCALHRTALEHCLSLLGDILHFLLIVVCIFIGSLVQLT